MKFFDIAFAIIIFQLVSAWYFTEAGNDGFTQKFSMEEWDQSDFTNLDNNMSTIMGQTEVTDEDALSRIVGFTNTVVQEATNRVLNPFKRYILTLPYILHVLLGVDLAFATMLSLPFYIVQIIGILQFATGRSFRDSE